MFERERENMCVCVCVCVSSPVNQMSVSMSVKDELFIYSLTRVMWLIIAYV